jgi:hypothetical protein
VFSISLATTFPSSNSLSSNPTLLTLQNTISGTLSQNIMKTRECNLHVSSAMNLVTRLRRYARNLNYLCPIYEVTWESFISTIRPNVELGVLIRSTQHELLRSIPSTDSRSPATYISAHVRRGDRKHRFAKLLIPLYQSMLKPLKTHENNSQTFSAILRYTLSLNLQMLDENLGNV